MTRLVRLNKIRDAIAAALWANTKSYELPAVCKRYGLDVVDDDEARLSAHRSKTVFVNTHTTGLTLPQLITLANKILEDYECPELEALINQSGAQGVAGEFKNLIFAANGPKPKIIFRDAINNDIKVIENAKYCLIYDKPLGAHGLTWDELVLWWMALNGRIGDKIPAGRTLYSRLAKSLSSASPPEQLLFKTYCTLYSSIGFGIPALIPQVYLHYDPYVRRDLMVQSGQLRRQRMDFLLLLPNRQRVVLEVDGMQHYSVDGQASPKLYAEMVAEDRQLRLAGYEMYRFGGYELAVERGGEAMLSTFFAELFKRHHVAEPVTA